MNGEASLVLRSWSSFSRLHHVPLASLPCPSPSVGDGLLSRTLMGGGGGGSFNQVCC